ncbi:MAG: 2-oxoglutarate dehydrogenase complex dihydrolipoyllysine-residue succinyltransferase [Planctomycetes bacterium]|nr:2-oxoglutarate dehydrogenase complex dihydrolipoyllysine-residue succinyltransferase [Planctomycetota bacterium]
MSVELKVPSVGESITEVQLGEWLKKTGDAVRADDALVVIETDKVTVELPAPVAGTLGKLLKTKGEKARVGEVIGYLEASVASTPAVTSPAVTSPAGTSPAVDSKSPTAREALVMPAAARELAQRGLSAAEVVASGPGGRLLKEDVQRHASASSAPQASATKSSGAPHSATPAKTHGTREEQVLPMTPMRKRIAERLVQAQHTAAILTTFNEVDMTNVMALRKAHQERFVERHKTKLGFMSFFVKAAIEALKEFPQVNAEIRGDEVVYKNYYDVGVAVGGGKGLVVPILRNAERMSFAEIEVAIANLGKRAQENKLSLDELVGGTFTISNGGIYGSLLSTPILNPPQSGILGLHAIQERPVVVGGQIVIRSMMYVALSYDHRIVDGREAVTFLKRIKECMEEPARMLLEV